MAFTNGRAVSRLPAGALKLFGPWLFLAGWMASLSAGALTVRVDPAGGAPRLVVNGAPVRARIFFGAPGSTPLPVSSNWSEVRFEFVASGSASNGTLHFRFGQKPGEIRLDDIQVAALDDPADLLPRCDFEQGLSSFQRDWTFWPQGAANTVGRIAVMPGAGHDGSAGLRVTLTAPPQGPWPDFHLYHHPRLGLQQGHRYRVSFWAKADPARDLTVAFYQPGDTFRHLGGPPDCFAAQIRLAAEVGVRFVSFPADLPWPRPGQAADWSKVDSACRQVLAANPQALLIPRFWMGAPEWWRQAHPDDLMQWEDGRRGEAVVASPPYRRDAADRLAAVVAHLEEKFGENVAGYHPCGQNTGEWFYQDTWKHPLNGYAPADLTAWRLWLSRQYASDVALQRAWNAPAATRSTVPVPAAAARHGATNGIFRSPVTEQALLDWASFQQQAMADCVCTLAHAARTASQGHKLVMFFYGYVFEFGAIQNGPATAGHYALRQVLNCPDVDLLCSPISYFDRGLGQSAPAMTAAESVALTGKMWLNEDDTHTYLAREDFPGAHEHVSTVGETTAELTRNVAQEALRNFATWWMDLGASGWFNDPALWSEMKRLQPLDEWLLRNPTPFRPEVAAVIDERSLLRVAAGGTRVTAPGLYEARAPLGRMGAPYGQYLLDDVLEGRVQAKLYVFLNAWALTTGERVKLAQATRDAACLWCYAPGYFDTTFRSAEPFPSARASLAAMRELTGLELVLAASPKARATPTEAGQRLGLRQSFGVDSAPNPFFAVTPGRGDEVLAAYPDGAAAVVWRRSPNGISVFAGAPGLTSELLRAVARAAGVHLFTETDCNVYASGPFVALHASQAGGMKINLGQSGPVSDVLTGKEIGAGPTLSLPFQRGETRILRWGR